MTVFAFAVACYPIYLVLSSIIKERRFQAFSRSNGCLPPHNDSTAWPLGLDRMYEILTARSKGLDPLEDFFVPPLYVHATLERSVLGQTILETIEPENIKTILASKFKDWEVGEGRNNAFRAVMGKNIFTSDGKFWEHSRALFRPQFARELINDLECVEREMNVLFEAVEKDKLDNNGWTSYFDFKPLVFRFVLDSATEFLFGRSIGSQKAFMHGGGRQRHDEDAEMAELASGEEFADAFDLCLYYMVIRIRLQQFVAFGTSKAFRQACQTVRRLPKHWVRKALANDGRNEKKKKFDLLTALVDQTQDAKELEDQTLGILFAGRDTTSSLLAWVMLDLGQNPDAFQKLRRVVLDTFPPTKGSNLDFTQLKSCRYLQHVMQESLRLHAVVPLNSRVALRDTILPVGGGPDGVKPVAVRKGQTVLWNIYAMQRWKALWGEDALEYDPDRWESPKQSRMLGGGWAYTPFSGGPRICVGRESRS